MNLTSISDLLRVVTSGTADIHVHTDWVDDTAAGLTASRTNTLITTATTTTIVGSPGASTRRGVSEIMIRNAHASAANGVRVFHTDGANATTLWEGNLRAGESVSYTNERGWRRHTDTGYETTAAVAAPQGTTVEVDLGSALIFQGSFLITDGSIVTTSKVLCWQAPGPYTGKGTRADEAAMQPVNVVAVEPLAGSARVRWETPPCYTQQPRVAEGALEGLVVARPELGRFFPGVSLARIGRVRGNVKFSYVVFN